MGPGPRPPGPSTLDYSGPGSAVSRFGRSTPPLRACHLRTSQRIEVLAPSVDHADGSPELAAAQIFDTGAACGGEAPAA